MMLTKRSRNQAVLSAFYQVESYLKETGWCQGTDVSEDGRVCLGQAVYHVLVDVPLDAGAVDKPVFKTLLLYLSNGSNKPHRAITDFNDAADRTVEEIFERIDLARTNFLLDTKGNI